MVLLILFAFVNHGVTAVKTPDDQLLTVMRDFKLKNGKHIPFLRLKRDHSVSQVRWSKLKKVVDTDGVGWLDQVGG